MHAVLASVVLAAGVGAGGLTGADRAVGLTAHEAVTATSSGTTSADPRRTDELFVDPQMPGSQKAAEDPTYAPIGHRAHAFWLTTTYGVSGIGAAVTGYVTRARDAGKVPVMALYALPNLNCSPGGLPTPAAYRDYVRRAAAAADGAKAIVVIEPDAVPLLTRGSCGSVRKQSRMLRFAVTRFAKAGAWVYLDAGHSAWSPARTIARLLKRSGIEKARGFSLNIANFRPTADEIRFAKRINKALRALQVRPKRFVIETARNGASPPPRPGDVCNPVEARLGQPPRMVFQGRLDGYLWVKHPGMSDGASDDDRCHGGPPSGWYDLGARRLLGLAG